MTAETHVAVALDGHGWHPEAWRHAGDSQPVTSGRYWTGLVQTAERGFLDFVTFDDSLSPQRRRRPDVHPRWLAGRPDAVLVAARVAPVTRDIGLIPVATTTHTEPFHVSKAIATLDHITRGRAGWQVRISSSRHEAELFGRRDPEDLGDLFAEAGDHVEVVRRLWDSWEDDAVLRDTATGRYLDRDKLHYIDFHGPFFSVKGPSITPRPPQGQPVVAALAHNPRVYEFAARSADLVFITPSGDGSVSTLRAEVAQAGGGHLLVYADLYVTFAGVVDERSDAEVFAGSPAELAEKILHWHDLGLDGIRLRPAVHATDLPVLVDEVIPLLQRANRFRTGYRSGETLRRRLGLPVARNRHAVERIS
ncbi:alkanesulfonate monooxygenase SsuD/methylene tetrahydromethanopterin reductase-like flavin-dependent oxidoreductase (luciferase family) [Mycolicibacterium iranicum]|uniref:Alkanesulfonate monooxygenase SsuD/methylene tetrahydromethanopterin reductase-like flavin-dependent oxidoreductase (Luciferase family) n=1 Tax=Mycolicibacterium iranicum TaxID=912594 RepID=A0A839Q304_MYCIR|nr:LLM class flavin-dependent oxidoreductase [Mycolicibacterium iranicum]MBB2989304.1 alkanesulfonate monooxygenase SsuD/methylene tetrahydromethanopterin reductase-like flavin-dependent oxidoreductase (luciferase family) [Mycolicibacterium iranicum]